MITASPLHQSIFFIPVFCILSAVPTCNCRKAECNRKPYTETQGIYFGLKDINTGNDILVYNGYNQPVPDSVKLKNISTGEFLPLWITAGVNGAIIYSLQYQRPAQVKDTLEFIFGGSAPDSLLVETGIVKGWRGDECPYVQDAGIIKVMLRGQVLVQTEYDDAVFVLKK